MVSGGCISHHNPLDAVGFASSKGKQDLSQSATRPSTTTRRSDTLHDKEALLYRHKVKNNALYRRTRIPDEDDDWGVQTPTRRIPINSAPQPHTSATTRTTTLSNSDHKTRMASSKALQSRSPKATVAPLSPSKRPRSEGGWVGSRLTVTRRSWETSLTPSRTNTPPHRRREHRGSAGERKRALPPTIRRS